MCLTRIIRGLGVGRLALLALAVSVAASAVAQEPPKSQSALARTIILPPIAVAGRPATLAVLDSAGRLLPNVAVELSGDSKVTTDPTGRALFVVPADATKLTAKIPGKEITASSTVVKPEIPAMPSSANAAANGRAPVGEGIEGLHLDSYPHVIAIRDRFTIQGTGFRGTADANHVFLADQPCLVVAASPTSLVVLPGPHIPIGAIALRVSVAGYDAGPFPLSAVILDISGPAELPSAGTMGKLLLSVHGSTEPLAVEVHNGSPEIIQLSHGNWERVETSGGEQNIAPVDVKFIAPGDYTITARLTPGGSGIPPGKN
jgi:hypothetical protein